MKWRYIILVFVLFCSCKAYNESLMVSIPIENAQKDTADSRVVSASARFFLGVIPLDGIERFDKNVFDELLFDVMAQKSTIEPDYNLAGYERYIHRRIGVLTYELKAFYYRDSKMKEEKIPVTSRQKSLQRNRVDSVRSETKKVIPPSSNLDQKLPLGLKTIMLAKKQVSRSEQGFKYVVVVACVRPERFNESVFERLQKRTEKTLAYYNTGDWVRVFVAEEYSEDVRKAVSKSFTGAWQCAFGK